MSDFGSRSKRRGEKVLSIAAVDAAIFTEPLKNAVFNVDEEGNLRVMPVIVLDPTMLKLTSDRSPNIMSNAQFSGAGAAPLWTPAAGKRFRLMGLSVFLANDATSAGGVKVLLLDGGATIMVLAAMGLTTGGIAYAVEFPNNGYLSTNFNNVLAVSLDNAITTDKIYVNCWGIEEPT